jgi:hypothetical protein
MHRALDDAADLSKQHYEVLLMPGIFPEALAGGIVYRDASGAALNPPGVENAYSPAAAFVITCPPTALPSDCTARIEPRQVNAVMSELIALAECFDPDGTWDCNKLTNLCTAFTAWDVNDADVDGVSIVGTGTTADPFTVGVIDCGVY